MLKLRTIAECLQYLKKREGSICFSRGLCHVRVDGGHAAFETRGFETADEGLLVSIYLRPALALTRV